MSKKLYFDIETIPASESSLEALKHLYEKKKSKFDETREDKDDEFMSFQDYFEKTCLDGAYGRILCIGYALDDRPLGVLCNPDDEKKTLEEFWDMASSIDIFVGHNIMEFDLRFILQRSRILGVKPSWKVSIEQGESKYRLPPGVKYLDFARYQNCPIYDTMCEWSNWGRPNVGLEHIALAMGIPSPKDGIDGSQVWNFFKAGKVKEICDYCKRDVDTTRKVYKRMTFELLPELERLPF